MMTSSMMQFSGWQFQQKHKRVLCIVVSPVSQDWPSDILENLISANRAGVSWTEKDDQQMNSTKQFDIAIIVQLVVVSNIFFFNSELNCPFD